MQLVDTHCHLDVERFALDREAVLARAFAGGVVGIVVPAIGPHDWDTLLGYPALDRRLSVGLGIHPQLLAEMKEEEDEPSLERLEGLLERGGAIAVGECGLDGPTAERAPFPRQVEVLKRHFALSRRFGLPLLVHVYRAHPQFVELLKEEGVPEAGLLLHSYSGGPDLARFYAKAGCHFALAGPVTYPGARKPLLSLKEIPPDRLMLETDAPDQAPHPHRGERSEPAYVRYVAQAMAAALGEDPDALARRTTENAARFFKRPFVGE